MKATAALMDDKLNEKLNLLKGAITELKGKTRTLQLKMRQRLVETKPELRSEMKLMDECSNIRKEKLCSGSASNSFPDIYVIMEAMQREPTQALKKQKGRKKTSRKALKKQPGRP